MNEQVDNLNFGGAIAQKLETIKSLDTLWNEYFSSLVYHALNTRGIMPQDAYALAVKGCANNADLMLAEYKERWVHVPL